MKSHTLWYFELVTLALQHSTHAFSVHVFHLLLLSRVMYWI